MIYSTRSIYLAFKFLTSKNQFKNSSNIWGALLGIGLSLIPLLVVLEISSGMIEGITSRYMEIGSYHLQIMNYNKLDNEIEVETIDKLKLLPGVKSVFPVSTGIGLAYSEYGRTGISFKALPENYLELDISVKQYITIKDGEFNLTTKDSAMLSMEVARLLKVGIGDRIKILTAKKIPGRRPVLKPSYLTVRGIFSTGYYELDALSIYINIDKGRSLFTEKGSSFIAVKLDNPFDEIEAQTISIRKNLETGFFVYNWYDLEKTMIESFNTTKSILLFIMIIIVIVAAMNISSTIVMLVMEKEEAIAMLMSTGVSPSVITRSFVYIGLILGIVGTFIGLLLGLLIAININEIIFFSEVFLNIVYNTFQCILAPIVFLSDKNLVLIDKSYYLEEIPIKIDLFNILIISTITILLSGAAAYFPAIKAGRIKPMDILRKH